MHITDDDLVLHYYGELSAREEAEAVGHLQTCGACHERFRRLQRVMAAVDESDLGTPPLAEHFERTVWARLEPDLRRGAGRGWSWFVLSPARLGLVAAVILLVGAAFVAGRLTPRGGDSDPSQVSRSGADLRERILLVDLDEHLDRSQMVLVELVNSGAAPSLVSNRAEQLVTANRLYRHTASATGEAAVAQLLDELERVLVEVAAGPEELSDRALERMRRRIEGQDLLFKLRVVSSELRERQKAPPPAPAGGRSSL